MKANTHFIISCSILLRTKNISDKIVEEIQTYILCSITFFSKIVPVMK